MAGRVYKLAGLLAWVCVEDTVSELSGRLGACFGLGRSCRGLTTCLVLGFVQRALLLVLLTFVLCLMFAYLIIHVSFT